MRIVCYLFGHSFWPQHGSEELCESATHLGSTKILQWQGLIVKKRCHHCGYEHSDTFRIPGTEKVP